MRAYIVTEKGRALRITIGLMMLGLLLAGGASAATLTVNANGSADYIKIQDAVNAASAGDTILVYSGTYYETVTVNKQLELKGQDMPVINTLGMGDAITVTANGVTIDGFYAKNCGGTCNGITVTSNNNVIKNNSVSNNQNGIFLSSSSNNTVSNNNISSINDGILLSGSNNNTIQNNIAGSVSYSVIDLEYSNNNNIINNNVSQSDSNAAGVRLGHSDRNTIKNNDASNAIIGGEWSDFNVLDSNFFNSNEGDVPWGDSGIILSYSSNNIITNNFIQNIGISNGQDYGIYLYFCNNFTIFGNTIDSKYRGIYLKYSQNNTINTNLISYNNDYGIYITSSIKNNISNNIFNNTNNVFTDTPNNWNTTKTAGTNIIGGSYLGGNFWDNPSSTGFSQTCSDADGDFICDSPYILDSSNIDSLPLVYKTSTFEPFLVFAITPNSRIAQIDVPITLYLSIINGGTATATNVSITQASNLPANVSYQPWDGSVLFTGAKDTPVNINAGETVHFVITIDATAPFDSSSMTFNVSGTNAATASIGVVNTLTISGSATTYADVIMKSTSLNVSTPVNTSIAFAVATTNVGAANATNVSLVLSVPSSITGVAYQVNQTNSTTGDIIGPATGLTITVGAQPTFAVFLTPTLPLAYDPSNNRITLQLVDGNGKIIGAQSVAVSTT